MNSYTLSVSASALTASETWALISEFITESEVLVTILQQEYDLTPEELEPLTKIIATKSTEFFNATTSFIYSNIVVPTPHTVNVTSYENNYRPIFEKQLQVISKAVSQNRSRGYTRQNHSIEEDVQFMFMSHYIDGNQGESAYFSEYGYQSANMADWITDDDRNAYKKLLNNFDTAHTLEAAGNVVKAVDTAITTRSDFKIVAAINTIQDTTKVLDFFASEIASKITAFIPESQIIDYSQFMAIAADELQYSDTITDFQERYYGRMSADFDYLPSFFTDSLVTVISAIVCSATMPVLGLTMIFSYNALYLAADTFRMLSPISLALTRNFRISERVNDYMMHLGYWW